MFFSDCTLLKSGNNKSNLFHKTMHFIQTLQLSTSKAHVEAKLTLREAMTLCGGVFLFIGFFVAMYAEGTADYSLFQVCFIIVFIVDNK